MEEMFVDMAPEQILNTPLCNKGSAFTREERSELGLDGLVPYHVSTLQEQSERRYQNFLSQTTQFSKFVFLNALQNRNEVLFYHLVDTHINEMLPYIYTPTVGSVSMKYSYLHSEHRGLYLSYPDQDRMESMLASFKHRPIDVVVVTDGERILGLGDVGIGGMTIPVGKLSLYTLFGGIHPSRTLPIFLDVGTNNQEYLDDVHYMGWRSPRVQGEAYYNFIDRFVQALKKTFPKALLQWEDFSKTHARPLLEKYQEKILSFNDDIQGTATVVLAAIFSALRLSKTRLKEQKIVLLGGGSAGLGICRMLVEAMKLEGCSDKEAFSRFYVVDQKGLLQTQGLWDEAQEDFVQDSAVCKDWSVSNPSEISLLEVVKNVKPTILIGVSTQKGAFTREVIETMASSCEKPLILPLSNPNDRCEAHPEDVIEWTGAKALLATGSPFPPVEYKHKLYPVAQCNNVYIFPGVGLAAVSFGLKKLTDKMFIAAASELSRHSPMLQDPEAPLFPSFKSLREISKEVALAVAGVAQQEGQIPTFSDAQMREVLKSNVWIPTYPTVKRKA